MFDDYYDPTKTPEALASSIINEPVTVDEIMEDFERFSTFSMKSNYTFEYYGEPLRGRFKNVRPVRASHREGVFDKGRWCEVSVIDTEYKRARVKARRLVTKYLKEKERERSMEITTQGIKSGREC